MSGGPWIDEACAELWKHEDSFVPAEISDKSPLINWGQNVSLLT